MEKQKIRLLVFFAFVIVSTCGVWMPLVFWAGDEGTNLFTWKTWTIEFATISLSSICASSIEKIMALWGDKGNRSTAAWNLLFVTVLWTICILIIAFVSREWKNTCCILAVLAYVITCIVWWSHNYNNTAYDYFDPGDTLGKGDDDNFVEKVLRED